MENNIQKLENALRQIDTAKKQLCRNTSEAKSRIQGSISRQLEALRNREVWLLNQLDTVSGAKEEILQQQSARLNKTLGVLQSSISFPQETESSLSSKLERLDLGELIPEETPYISFKCDPARLRTAIMDFGKVASNVVSPLQSPFMAAEEMAPSLPKHLEEYEDADHHVLYKTVEEINRARSEQPCVKVSIPKLSSRIEDWLLYPTSASNCGPSGSNYYDNNPPYNPADWLTAPPQRPLGSDGGRPLEAMSADASIKNWLYKIKQCPYEEEDDDFEFIDEMSDTKTSQSLEEFPRPHSPMITGEAWLHTSKTTYDREADIQLFKVPDLPQEMWLLKADDKPNISPEQQIDMSRYFTKISDEVDKWLYKGSGEPLMSCPFSSSAEQRTSENPWLMSSRSSSARSRSHSPAYSTASSTTSSKSKKKSINKWLLSGQSSQPTSYFSCPFMEKYQNDMNKLNWLKSSQPQVEYNLKGVSNPMSCFENQGSDISKWLKPGKLETSFMEEETNPLTSVLEKYKGTTPDQWLLSREPNICDAECKVIDMRECGEEDGKWLMPATNLSPVMEQADDDNIL